MFLTALCIMLFMDIVVVGSGLCCAPPQHQKNPLFGDFSVEMNNFIPSVLLGFNLGGNCGAETLWILQDHSLKDLGEISFHRS